LKGHVLSDEQVRIILGTGVEEVIIAMDNDVPNRRGLEYV